MPWALLVTPSGLPTQDPYTIMYYLVIVRVRSICLQIQLLGHAGQAISCVGPNLHAPNS